MILLLIIAVCWLTKGHNVDIIETKIERTRERMIRVSEMSKQKVTNTRIPAINLYWQSAFIHNMTTTLKILTTTHLTIIAWSIGQKQLLLNMLKRGKQKNACVAIQFYFAFCTILIDRNFIRLLLFSLFCFSINWDPVKGRMERKQQVFLYFQNSLNAKNFASSL